MDRASDSGSEGWGFESLPAYQIKERIPTRGILSFISPSGREGLERAAPVVSPAQKLRAGEQFLARGRVLHIPDASGTDVDGI